MVIPLQRDNQTGNRLSVASVVSGALLLSARRLPRNKYPRDYSRLIPPPLFFILLTVLQFTVPLTSVRAYFIAAACHTCGCFTPPVRRGESGPRFPLTPGKIKIPCKVRTPYKGFIAGAVRPFMPG